MKKYDKFTWWTPKFIPRLTLYGVKPLTKWQWIWTTKGCYTAYIKLFITTFNELRKLPKEELTDIRNNLNKQKSNND